MAKNRIIIQQDWTDFKVALKKIIEERFIQKCELVEMLDNLIRLKPEYKSAYDLLKLKLGL